MTAGEYVRNTKIIENKIRMTDIVQTSDIITAADIIKRSNLMLIF